MGKIWVRLGCNKNSSGFLGAPKVAIGAVKLQLVTTNTRPAIFFKHSQRIGNFRHGPL